MPTTKPIKKGKALNPTSSPSLAPRYTWKVEKVITSSNSEPFWKLTLSFQGMLLILPLLDSEDAVRTALKRIGHSTLTEVIATAVHGTIGQPRKTR